MMLIISVLIGLAGILSVNMIRYIGSAGRMSFLMFC